MLDRVLRRAAATAAGSNRRVAANELVALLTCRQQARGASDTTAGTDDGIAGLPTIELSSPSSSSPSSLERARPRSPVPPPAIVKTPVVLEQALSDLQRTIVQDHPKRFRQLGKSLLQNLKMKSLSKHRGGLQPNYFDARRGPRPAFRGSSRQQERRALKALADSLDSLNSLDPSNPSNPTDPSKPTDPSNLSSAPGGDLESIKRALQSHPSYRLLKQSAEEHQMRAQTRDLVPTKLYNGLGALAYATARLPSTYAAVRNVFQRLKMSHLGDPSWSPQTMLDFGAGPGTAAWAARAVWPASRVRVTNVEGSATMADIGYRIQRLVDDATSEAGLARDAHDEGDSVDSVDSVDAVDRSNPRSLDVRWVRGLPRDRIENRFDICVASYSLNELPGQVERHQLLNRLIRSATEYIVLVEHGTPHGFAIIVDSRPYVLKVSRKLGMPFHVAAPCPHDGPCPLRDKRAWCHFSQRHVRTVEQRVAVKSLTGSAPRDAYTERFSYVVLKRGMREGAERADGAKRPVSSEQATALLLPRAHDEGAYDRLAGRDRRQELAHAADVASVPNPPTTNENVNDKIETNDTNAILQRVRNSRILRRRKRKGHVVLDLCSVLDADGALMADGTGTILRQTVSKGKSKSSWDGGNAYRAAKTLSQGDEWPLLFQIRGNAVETPVMEARRDEWRGDRGADAETPFGIDSSTDDELAFLFDDDDDNDDEDDEDDESDNDDDDDSDNDGD